MFDKDADALVSAVSLEVTEAVFEYVEEPDAAERLSSDEKVRDAVKESVMVKVVVRLGVAELVVDATSDSDSVTVFEREGECDGVGGLAERL